MYSYTPGKLEIERVPYAKLRKSEMAEYASQTISIVQEHNPELLLIESVFNQLLAQKPKIDILGLHFGRDPLVQEVAKEKAKLMLTVSTFKLKARLISKSNSNAGLHLVSSVINAYLRYLNKLNDKEVSQKIKGFLNATEVNEELFEALTDHDLMAEVGEIELAHKSMQKEVNKRLSLLAVRPDMPTKFAIDKLVEAIDNAFKTIEVNALINTELDYEPLIDELSQLSYSFKLSVSIREANNRRKAKEQEEGEEEADNNGMTAPGANGEDEEGEVEMKSTSTSLFNGYKPYQLSIPSGNGGLKPKEKETHEVGEKSISASLPKNGALQPEPAGGDA